MVINFKALNKRINELTGRELRMRKRVTEAHTNFANAHCLDMIILVAKRNLYLWNRSDECKELKYLKMLKRLHQVKKENS